MALYIVGTGGFAKEVACLAEDCGHDDIVFLSQNERDTINGIPVIPLSEVDMDYDYDQVVVAVGNPALRRKIITTELSLRTQFATLIHPSVVMSERWVTVGVGSVICAGSILTCNINLGAFSQINLNTTIGHDVNTGEYFTTAPGVHVSGNVTAGDCVYLGTNATVIEKIKICGDVTVGANACVVKDLMEPGTYVGVPAKKLEK
jgi:sugar O-acyltransferase (sialic acid O-acetyltransferase NeuD family)